MKLQWRNSNHLHAARWDFRDYKFLLNWIQAFVEIGVLFIYKIRIDILSSGNLKI